MINSSYTAKGKSPCNSSARCDGSYIGHTRHIVAHRPVNRQRAGAELQLRQLGTHRVRRASCCGQRCIRMPAAMLLPVPPLPSGQLPGPGWPQHAAPTASRVAAAAHFRGLVVQAVAAHGRRLRAQWHVNVLLRQFCQAAAMPTRPLGHGRRPSAALQAPFRPRGLPFAQRAWRHRRVRAPA